MTNRYSEMVVSVLIVLLWATSAFAAPLAVPYNGFLTDSDGKAYQGNVPVIAELYEDFEGGVPATTCTYSSLKVDSGIVSFVMGDGCTPPVDSTLFAAEGMWLSVTINGTTLEPRQEVLSVPYALSAEDTANLGGFPAEDYLMVSELEEGGYLSGEDVNGVCMSGDWNDLAVKPDLSVYLKADGTVALAGPWDLAGQALSNVVIGASETPPEGATAGQLWWDSAAGSLKVHTGESWVLVSAAEGAAVAADLDCVGCVSKTELGFELADVATSGEYEALSGAPDLAGYALTANLQPVCITGSYEDLVDLDLSAFVSLDDLAAVAISGDYDDLSNVPDLAGFLILGDLALVASSGAYEDLSGTPDLSLYLQADGSVGLSGDLDVAKHRLLNVAVDASGEAPAAPVAGQLWYDGSGKVLRVWTGMEWLSLGSGAGALPKDGLSAVSNGTLSNFFQELWSSEDVPVDIPDNYPAGKQATFEVAGSGVLTSLGVHVVVTHPDASELELTLFAPDGEEFVLHDHSVGDDGGLDRTYPPTQAASGDLTTLLDKSPAGVWTLEAADTQFSGAEPGSIAGTIDTFELTYEVLRDDEVAVSGDAAVSGALTVGSLTVGETDVAAELAALKGEVWCLKNCDSAKIGDCKNRDCDGAAQTCTEAGLMPDGTACQGGAGTCMAGECCVPLSCFLLGEMCGEADDGCGGWLDCGLCQAPEAVCFENQCCVPETCESLGKECGDWGDGCGDTVQCGGCGEAYECTQDGACECGNGLPECGGICCPELAGYAVSCNSKDHCEYANEDSGGWKQYDVWIYIAPGSFQMGSEGEGGGSSETPVHSVNIGYGYFISKYAIVVEEYNACNAAEPDKCSTPSTVDWNGAEWGTNYWADETDGSNVLQKRLDHPQNGLTWQQAKDFCGWVAPNGRLPSEAEWEYAATGPVHLKYPWGDSPDPTCSNDTAVFNQAGGTGGYGCGQGGTWAVGSKTAGASWCGALDMSGNLWEWNEDCWHVDYTGGAPDNGSAWTGNCDGSTRVLRGGSFNFGAVYLRSAERGSNPPGARYASLGGRCLRPLP